MKRLASLAAMAALFVSMSASGPSEERLKLEFDELAARATALLDNLEAVERRARAMGQALHPSIGARRALVRSSMGDAERALCSHDMDGLRECLGRARAHIDRLYRML